MIRARHLQMASRFLTHRFQELHPFEVQANFFTYCDLRCVYCTCPHAATTLLSTEQWREIIRGLGRLGTIRLKFQGGEPTLRPDFRELSAEAKDNGIISAVVSHGQAIPSRPELLDYIDEIIISLDSPNEEVNDRLRGQGSYQAAVAAIDVALQRGVRTFVNAVLTSENFSDLEAMLEFCEARGILMNAQPVIYEGRYFGGKAQALALTQEEVREVHQKMAEWKRQGRGMLFSAWAYQKAADWPDTNVLTVKSEGLSPCVAGREYIHIEPDGDVFPCVLQGGDFTPKNILKDGLGEALRHARHHNCGDCWVPFSNERKATFRLRPSAIREVFRRDRARRGNNRREGAQNEDY